MAPKAVDGKTLPGKAAPTASEKPKKGRKRKTPAFDENGEEIVHTGPGRPRKNAAAAATTSTSTTSAATAASKVKKTTPVKEKKEPKKKYAKLT